MYIHRYIHTLDFFWLVFFLGGGFLYPFPFPDTLEKSFCRNTVKFLFALFGLELEFQS